MKNQFIIPSIIIAAAILGGIWMLKQPSAPQEVIVVPAPLPPPPPPNISIHDAVKNGNIEAVKQHIAAGTDANGKDADGWTILHGATFNGHKEIAELLIANGADVNLKDDVGDTPLNSAIIKNRTEIFYLLRKHGGKTGKELKAAGN